MRLQWCFFGLFIILAVGCAWIAAGCVPKLDVLSGTGGSTATAGQGGAGGSSPCEPGSEASCYSGVVGAEGIGVCTLGTKVCASDGHSYGQCSGSGTPSLEDCSSQEDENCDGEPGCLGKCMWTRRFEKRDYDPGTTLKVGMGGIATDENWNTIVVGSYRASANAGGIHVDMGGGDLDCDGNLCSFVGKYDPLGSLLWSTSFDHYAAESVHALKSGELIVAAQGGSPSVGNICGITGGQGWNVAVVKLSPQGKCVDPIWGMRFEGETLGKPSVAVDDVGAVYVAVTFASGGNIDGTSVGSSALVRLSPETGNVDWVVPFGNSQTAVKGIAVDSIGDLYIIGDISSTTMFGTITVQTNYSDIFVAKYSPGKSPGDQGQWSWAVSMGGQGQLSHAGDLVVTKNNRLFITGLVSASIQPGGKCASLPSPQDGALLLAQLDADAGTCLRADEFLSTGTSYQYYQYLRLRADSNSKHLIVAGVYGTPPLDLGGVLPTYSSQPIFVAKFDDTLKPVWSQGFGGQYTALSYALAVDPGGSILLAGDGRTVDFGCGAASEEEGNFFLTRLSP